MPLRENLTQAKINKNDEFYTQLKDIENELKHYKHHFKDKVIYCNADDPRASNFTKYFKNNFDRLGLKKLISTSHKPNKQGKYYIETKGGATWGQLNNDGDFKSEECIEFLKESDIIVTNPPFSIFREYFAQLMEHDKKFLIIGNINAITYKGVFPLIKNNEIWLGHNANKTMEFKLPKDYHKWDRLDDQGNKFGKGPATSWFTNLTHNKRNEHIPLVKEYNKEEYPKYDNYDAINVDRVANIPKNYGGIMGVPITFLTRYNPEQFEILGINTSYSDELNHEEAKPIKKYTNVKQYSKSGKVSNGSQINNSSTLLHKIQPDKTYYKVDGMEDDYLTITYARIFIKRRCRIE